MCERKERDTNRQRRRHTDTQETRRRRGAGERAHLSTKLFQIGGSKSEAMPRNNVRKYIYILGGGSSLSFSLLASILGRISLRKCRRT